MELEREEDIIQKDLDEAQDRTDSDSLHEPSGDNSRRNTRDSLLDGIGLAGPAIPRPLACPSPCFLTINAASCVRTDPVVPRTYVARMPSTGQEHPMLPTASPHPAAVRPPASHHAFDGAQQVPPPIPKFAPSSPLHLNEDGSRAPPPHLRASLSPGQVLVSHVRHMPSTNFPLSREPPARDPLDVAALCQSEPHSHSPLRTPSPLPAGFLSSLPTLSLRQRYRPQAARGRCSECTGRGRKGGAIMA